LDDGDEHEGEPDVLHHHEVEKECGDERADDGGFQGEPDWIVGMVRRDPAQHSELPEPRGEQEDRTRHAQLDHDVEQNVVRGAMPAHKM